MRHILNAILLFFFIVFVAKAQPNSSSRNIVTDVISSGGDLTASPSGDFVSNAPFVFYPLTEVQRDALPAPVGGSVIYNTDTGQLNVYSDSWGTIGDTVSGTPAGVFYAGSDGKPKDDVEGFAYNESSQTLSVSGGFESSSFTNGLVLVSVGGAIGEATPLADNQHYSGSNLDPTSVTGGSNVTIGYSSVTGGKLLTISATGGGSFSPACVILDLKSTGTSGGVGVDDSPTARDLNTLQNSADCSSNIGLASNQITLTNSGSGFYVRWATGFRNVATVQTYFRDTSDGANQIQGTNGNSIVNSSHLSNGAGLITATGTYELVYYLSGGGSADQLGVALNLSGQDEIYSVVEIWEL